MDLKTFLTQTVVSSAFVIAIVSPILAFIFNRMLESRKSELALENQKLIQNFNLYTTKRHETYPELYKLLLIANDKVKVLIGDYEEHLKYFTLEELKRYLATMGISAATIDELLHDWDDQYNIFPLQKVAEYLHKIEFEETKESWDEANDYLRTMELYLSEDVATMSKELLGYLNDYLVYKKYPIKEEEIIKEGRALRGKISDIILNIKRQMREELS